MAISIEPTPGSPAPNTRGHYAHHFWLEGSVEQIASEALSLDGYTPPTLDITGMAEGDLKTIAQALAALGLVTQST